MIKNGPRGVNIWIFQNLLMSDFRICFLVDVYRRDKVVFRKLILEKEIRQSKLLFPETTRNRQIGRLDETSMFANANSQFSVLH